MHLYAARRWRQAAGAMASRLCPASGAEAVAACGAPACGGAGQGLEHVSFVFRPERSDGPPQVACLAARLPRPHHTNRAPALRPLPAQTRSLRPTVPERRCVQAGGSGSGPLAADAGILLRGACRPACQQLHCGADTRAPMASVAVANTACHAPGGFTRGGGPARTPFTPRTRPAQAGSSVPLHHSNTRFSFPEQRAVRHCNWSHLAPLTNLAPPTNLAPTTTSVPGPREVLRVVDGQRPDQPDLLVRELQPGLDRGLVREAR